MPFNFQGKRALVTGAGQGIGRAVCIKLAEYGAQVVALSRTQSTLDSLKKEVPSIETICVDVGEWEATNKAVEASGLYHLLVNNAGIGFTKPFLETEQSEIDQVFNVNYKGAVNVSQIVARKLVNAKIPGSIVNVSSIASHKALNGHTSYSASKAAMDITTQIMALELGQYKIRVNSVNPTVVFTNMGRKHWSDPQKLNPLLERIPLGRVAEEEDVVNAILFLLSDEASFISGACLPIDGGQSVVGTSAPQAASK